MFYKLQISDILYTFILAKSKKVKKLELTCQDFRLCVELPIKARLNKLNFKDCQSFERARYSGKKKVNELKDGFLILLYMIKFFFLKFKL
jgi:hypothetical protein